jgi:hypothetical protein
MTEVSRRQIMSTLATGSASLALAAVWRPDAATAQTTTPVAKAFQGAIGTRK